MADIWVHIRDGLLIAGICATIGTLWHQNSDLVNLKRDNINIIQSMTRRDEALNRIETHLTTIDNKIDVVSDRLTKHMLEKHAAIIIPLDYSSLGEIQRRMK